MHDPWSRRTTFKKEACRVTTLVMGALMLLYLQAWRQWTVVEDAEDVLFFRPPPPPRPVVPAEKVHTRWIVVTTIQAPTPQVERLCSLPGWRTVVVGDVKTPEKAWRHHPHCRTFLSLEDQDAMGYRIATLLPLNNYGRKNVGFLYAIEHGAREIYETDDDNESLDGLCVFHPPLARLVGSVQNPYAYFGRPDIWPRGYPLHEINRSRVPILQGCPNDAPIHPDQEWPIQQGVVDLDPDVDALFRMTQTTQVGQIRFLRDVVPVALAAGTYCPWNSQNTYWLTKAFWGLLLPVTPTIRVCDIWRSYWVQRILWELGEEILFMPATAEQVRNPHDFYLDYKQERDLYDKVPDLIYLLQQWECPVDLNLFGCIRNLTRLLAARGYWEELDAQLVDAWLQDLLQLGYIMPARRRLPPPQQEDRGCAPSILPPNTSMVLMIRTFASDADGKHGKEFWQLMRNLDLFMPSRPLLIVVLDNESARDHTFGRTILEQVSNVQVMYEAPNKFYKGGHARQQWSMFWFDQYVPAHVDYIAIVDTDVIFTSAVTRDLLFDPQGRPRVKAIMERRLDHEFWKKIPLNTQRWLGGLPEVFRAMCYFPVILWRDDLRFIRERLSFIHGKEFNAVFARLAPDYGFSQFNIWFNMLYYMRQDRYAWHFQPLQEDAETLDITTKKGNPGQVNGWSYQWLRAAHAELFNPVVGAAVHLPYASQRLSKLGNRMTTTLVEQGYCDLAGVVSDDVRLGLFEYDGIHWAWDTEDALLAQRDHWQNVHASGFRFSARQHALVHNLSCSSP